MKKSLILCSLTAIVAFAAGLKVGQPNDLQVANYNTLPYKVEVIKAYKDYNKATEELLDTLENQYGWTDGYDAYDYYESREKLDSLINLEN